MEEQQPVPPSAPLPDSEDLFKPVVIVQHLVQHHRSQRFQDVPAAGASFETDGLRNTTSQRLLGDVFAQESSKFFMSTLLNLPCSSSLLSSGPTVASSDGPPVQPRMDPVSHVDPRHTGRLAGEDRQDGGFGRRASTSDVVVVAQGAHPPPFDDFEEDPGGCLEGAAVLEILHRWEGFSILKHVSFCRRLFSRPETHEEEQDNLYQLPAQVSGKHLRKNPLPRRLRQGRAGQENRPQRS